jgi:hypothetical protein
MWATNKPQQKHAKQAQCKIKLVKWKSTSEHKWIHPSLSQLITVKTQWHTRVHKYAEFKDIKNTFQHHPITPCNKIILLDEVKSNMWSEFSYHHIDL